jgi:hypothetical protein
MGTQGEGDRPAAGSRRRSLGKKYRTTRLTTVTPPPTRAPRAPFAAATCVPSVPHGSVGSMRPYRACPACTSPIFARCASSPGTACATLRALLCPARAPREVRRVVLAGREARVDPGGASARARPARRALEGGYLVPERLRTKFNLSYHLPLTTYHLPLTTYHLPLTTSTGCDICDMFFSFFRREERYEKEIPLLKKNYRL